MQLAALKSEDVLFALRKADVTCAAFQPTGRTALALVTAIDVCFDGAVASFAAGTAIEFDAEAAVIGGDYEVVASPTGRLYAVQRGTATRVAPDMVFGGFHYAPGGNASGTSGGDDVPAINPYSCWDLNWRPACENASAMALVDGKFWCDIYLTVADHRVSGSSRHGYPIADGDERPTQGESDKRARSFDFETAKAVLAEHGKQLLGAEEFFAMAYGVTERSAAGTDPQRTGLDAPRTSRWGIMQATGNMWTWGTDGHPDIPRASIFGGSWFNGSNAGSRYAYLDYWPEASVRSVGARGRSDHLILE